MAHEHMASLLRRDEESWPAPNFINPEVHNWVGTSFVIVFFALSIFVFTARIWARLAVAKNAGLDDLVAVVSLIPLIALSIVVILGNRKYGFQMHIWDQSASSWISARQVVFSIQITYLAATSLIKISILLFYRRLSSGCISPVFLYTVWALMLSVIIYYVSFTFAFIFTCTPTEGFWYQFDIPWRLHNEVTCRDEGAISVAAVVISTVQDFFICILPTSLVWNLQIATRQKVALIAIFSLGLITCLCGIMRTYYAIYIYYFTLDASWWAHYAWVWTALEAQLGLICASAPAMKIYFIRYFSSTRVGYSSHGYPRSSGMRPQDRSTGISGQSLGTSYSKNIPLDKIKVSKDIDVLVESQVGDDMRSQSSHSSTRNLTQLHSDVLPIHRESTQETSCSAYQHESTSSVDIELPHHNTTVVS